MTQNEEQAGPLTERDAAALEQMTVDQALASIERYKEQREIRTRAVLKEIQE